MSIHSSIGVKLPAAGSSIVLPRRSNAHGQPRNAMEFLDNASAIGA